MVVFRLEVNFPVREADLLSYAFDSPYPHKAEPWQSYDPLTIRTWPRLYRLYLGRDQSAAKRVGCSLHRLGAHRKHVALYGDVNFHFPLAFLAFSLRGVHAFYQ